MIKGILGNVRSFLFSLPVVVAVVQTEEDSVISTEHKATQSNKTPLYCHAGRGSWFFAVTTYKHDKSRQQWCTPKYSSTLGKIIT
jgi:hypothetical protein